MRSLHILLLTARDWTHPAGGDPAANLHAQVTRWVDWGHRVTVVAGSYDGAQPVEQLAPGLTIHRLGKRRTVIPRTAWAVRRRLAHDADIVLEAIDGVPYLTPLWLRRRRVALVYRLHRRRQETLPLQLLYRVTPFVTISNAVRDQLVELGVEDEHVHVTYMGVEPSRFERRPRTDIPALVHVGPLEPEARIELLLDLLEHVPDATLDVAGDGSRREALEREVEQRGLRDRARLLGALDEPAERELYARSWLAVSASSVEGWRPSVAAAAACGTPSAALRVDGLDEAIVDGVTGVLASTPAELADRTREIVADEGLRTRLGDAAEQRARSFTWEHAAQQNLAVLESAASTERLTLRGSMQESETFKAAGLAGAALAANALAVVFTIVFARLLGATDYGTLAALLSTFLILAVPGSAFQVAVAREVALGQLGERGALAATLSRWFTRLLLASAVATAVAVLLRHQIAALIGVGDEQAWAAAMTIPAGCAWLILSVLRGALQGLREYRTVGLSIVGEAFGRLVFGLALVAAGLGVTGAYLGTPLAMAAAAGVLAIMLFKVTGPSDHGRERRSLRSMIGNTWAPVLGLTLIAMLQNIDVIMVKHQIGGDEAGSYAAAAVAAKAIIWVAIGVGLYLLPEAARRAGEGEDPRPVFVRALIVVSAIALPGLVLFAIVPKLLLEVAFGPDLTQASDALFVLGLAMALLAIAYLAVQYMLALRRILFLPLLAAVAVLEPIVLSGGITNIVTFAVVVLALQCVAAAGMLALSLRSRTPAPAPT